ncbi:unnamed protein product [Rotaria sordida]|uniref:Membrane protein BRI3 n=1 Tax=Rotaria sordida TaxID=392033 RepID=A0A814PQZ7_9BILA|nr:unnamed protein product [Rotaria sordida]CAF3840705.1 unnamed protein product [Rotaria sordida]
MSYPGQPNYGTCPPPHYEGNPGYCPSPHYEGNAGYCPPPPPTIIAYHTVGNCPSCHQGILTSQVSCLGICCAIFLFPIGLICLFALQEQRCSLCGYTV